MTPICGAVVGFGWLGPGVVEQPVDRGHGRRAGERGRTRCSPPVVSASRIAAVSLLTFRTA